MSFHRARAPRFAWIALASFLGAGCVERTLFIRTDPPDCEVIVDAKHVGRSPVTVPFVYGGTHEIVVFRPQPRRPDETVSWKPKIVYYDTERFAFDGPVVDFFVDLAPISFDDRQELAITLEPSNTRALFSIDEKAFWDSLRERADVVRVRARETQLDARPLSEAESASRPASRP